MNATASKREQIMAAMKKELDVMHLDLKRVEAGARDAFARSCNDLKSQLKRWARPVSTMNRTICRDGAL